MVKVKYPLTLEAKEAAKLLVHAWESGEIEQYFELSDHTTIDAKNRELYLNLGGNEDTYIPSLGILLELDQFKLIVVTSQTDIIFDRNHRSYSVVLMQELRSAVANDFEVSDFFLTTQAVGTIINAAENSSVIIPALQSAASNFGDIDQIQINTLPELTEKLLEVLGKDTLDSNPELAKAIQELATIEEPKRKLQVGKVITELGNCLRHIATTANVITALGLLARFLYTNHVL